jgi:hypothetical protein
VFAGVVLGTALLALLTTLWFALAFNSDVETVRVNLEWYAGITAIVSLFIGGLLAGWLSGVRGGRRLLHRRDGLGTDPDRRPGRGDPRDLRRVRSRPRLGDHRRDRTHGGQRGHRALGVVLDDPRWVPRLGGSAA